MLPRFVAAGRAGVAQSHAVTHNCTSLFVSCSFTNLTVHRYKKARVVSEEEVAHYATLGAAEEEVRTA